MEPTCKGIIYKTMKSKLPNTRCKNKAKDANGFCLQHKKQSEAFERKRQYEADVCYFDINDDKNLSLTPFRANIVMPIGRALRDYQEKYNMYGCELYCDGAPVDLNTPCGFYANKTLIVKM